MRLLQLFCKSRIPSMSMDIWALAIDFVDRLAETEQHNHDDEHHGVEDLSGYWYGTAHRDTGACGRCCSFRSCSGSALIRWPRFGAAAITRHDAAYCAIGRSGGTRSK